MSSDRVDQRRKPRMEIAEYEEKMMRRRTGYDGAERVSSVPVAPPIGYERKPSMVEYIRGLVRDAVSAQAEGYGMDTFAEADDFDVEDDPFPASSFEMEDEFEPEPAPAPSPKPKKGSKDDDSHSPDDPTPPDDAADPKPPEPPQGG